MVFTAFENPFTKLLGSSLPSCEPLRPGFFIHFSVSFYRFGFPTWRSKNLLFSLVRRFTLDLGIRMLARRWLMAFVSSSRSASVRRIRYCLSCEAPMEANGTNHWYRRQLSTRRSLPISLASVSDVPEAGTAFVRGHPVISAGSCGRSFAHYDLVILRTA